MTLPTYKYRPRGGGQPLLTSHSSTRARLFGAGTFFRARDPGTAGNRLSVQVVSYSTAEGYLVVTNYNLQSDENLSPNAEGSVLVLELGSLEQVVIEDLTTSPRAVKYSISAQIAPARTLPGTALGSLSFDAPFSSAGSVTCRLIKPTAGYTVGDEIIIQHRRRVYQLVPKQFTDPETGAVTDGWDISALRTAVNSSDPWISMPVRGTDAHDQGDPFAVEPVIPADAQVMPLTFAEKWLFGGDGLPSSPNGLSTGPTRSIIKIDEGEDENGFLQPINKVLEWAGESATQGAWVDYSPS